MGTDHGADPDDDSGGGASVGADGLAAGSDIDPSADRWADVLGPDGTLEVDRTGYRLRPPSSLSAIDTVVDEVLADSAYTVGDWFGFPDPVLLVHDRERGATFRLVVREDVVELHLLPGADGSAVDALLERCQAATGDDWSAERVDAG